MTVAELIAELKKVPPDALIEVTGCYSSRADEVRVKYDAKDHRLQHCNLGHEHETTPAGVCYLETDICSG